MRKKKFRVIGTLKSQGQLQVTPLNSIIKGVNEQKYVKIEKQKKTVLNLPL